MSSRESLNHRIKVNRRIRKFEESQKLIHPALKSEWDGLNREEQIKRLLKWTIATRNK
jgi:hypothetical protein